MGDMKRKNSALYSGSFLFLAITVILGATQPAFAQFTNFNQNYVHATWVGTPGQGFPVGPTIPPTNFGADESTYPLFQQIPFEMICPDPLTCEIRLPNLVDDLENKIIFVDILFDPQGGPAPLQLPSADVQCVDSTGTSPGVIHEEGPDPQDPQLYIYDIWCQPNPDWEEIVLHFNTPSEILNIQFIEIWTETFDDPPVGGTFVPIDTSALLLAGAASVSMWMIPVVVAGAGIGVFVIKRRN